MSAAEVIRLVAEDTFWSAIAATGFAVLFNVPRRLLWGCALAGATGHATRTLLTWAFELPLELTTLVGATVVGFLSMYLAVRMRTPALIFAVTGAIPMVPGLFAYSTMLGLIRLAIDDPTAGDAVLVEAAINGMRTGLILGAIALGIAMPKLLFQRGKPVG